MSEARLEKTEHGVAPDGDGWFVMNVHDAAWLANGAFGEACIFESETTTFPQIGYTLHVLHPGQPNGLYHYEADQEDFLVLAGECVAILEEEERRLGPGDFVHCPPGTEHIFVGAGEGPCVIFMVGARQHRGQIRYTRSEAALRYGAAVETEQGRRDEPYAPFPKWEPAAAPDRGALPL